MITETCRPPGGEFPQHGNLSARDSPKTLRHAETLHDTHDSSPPPARQPSGTRQPSATHTTTLQVLVWQRICRGLRGSDAGNDSLKPALPPSRTTALDPTRHQDSILGPKLSLRRPPARQPGTHADGGRDHAPPHGAPDPPPSRSSPAPTSSRGLADQPT